LHATKAIFVERRPMGEAIFGAKASSMRIRGKIIERGARAITRQRGAGHEASCVSQNAKGLRRWFALHHSGEPIAKKAIKGAVSWPAPMVQISQRGLEVPAKRSNSNFVRRSLIARWHELLHPTSFQIDRCTGQAALGSNELLNGTWIPLQHICIAFMVRRDGSELSISKIGRMKRKMCRRLGA